MTTTTMTVSVENNLFKKAFFEKDFFSFLQRISFRSFRNEREMVFYDSS